MLLWKISKTRLTIVVIVMCYTLLSIVIWILSLNVVHRSMIGSQRNFDMPPRQIPLYAKMADFSTPPKASGSALSPNPFAVPPSTPKTGPPTPAAPPSPAAPAPLSLSAKQFLDGLDNIRLKQIYKTASGRLQDIQHMEEMLVATTDEKYKLAQEKKQCEDRVAVLRIQIDQKNTQWQLQYEKLGASKRAIASSETELEQQGRKQPRMAA